MCIFRMVATHRRHSKKSSVFAARIHSSCQTQNTDQHILWDRNELQHTTVTSIRMCTNFRGSSPSAFNPRPYMQYVSISVASSIRMNSEELNKKVAHKCIHSPPYCSQRYSTLFSNKGHSVLTGTNKPDW